MASGARDRTFWAGLILGLGFSAAAGTQLALQTFRAPSVIDRAIESKHFAGEIPEPAPRGRILTADGAALATMDSSAFLELDFSELPKSPALVTALAGAAGISTYEIEAARDAYVPAAEGRKARGKVLRWKKPLDASQQARVNKVREDWKAEGIALVADNRIYPLADRTSTLVGVVRSENGFGIEHSFDKELRGEDGLTVGLRDRNGRFLPMRSDRKKTMVPGQDVELTIDSRVQSEAQEALREVYEKHDFVQGVAVAIDPFSGDILAMAEWPTYRMYSPTGRLLGPELEHTYVQALTSVYEPGSTFKVLSLAKALDDGLSPGFAVRCPGYFEVAGRRVSCSHGKSHGPTDITKAIAVSCNVAASAWSRKVGRDPLLQYYNEIGLFRRVPELGLSPQNAGRYDKTTLNDALLASFLGFGQSVSVTPLALTAAFAPIANGGYAVTPRLVRSVGGVERIPAGYMDHPRVLKEATAAQMRRIMEAVVEGDEGTGRHLRIPGYRLSGKTGTAERQGREGVIASFVGFVPSEKPKAVVMVIVDRPRAGSHFGGQVAGPVFRRMARTILRVNDIPPTEAAH